MAAEEERMEITEEEMRLLQQQRQQREEDEMQQFMPMPPQKKIPAESDVQLAEKLMEVKGGTARENITVDVVEGNKVVGKKVVESKNLFYETINENITKANLGLNDLAVVRGLCMRSNHTQAISKAFKVDLSPTQKVLADGVMVFNASSRGKEGWNAILSKTDRAVTQQTLEKFTKETQDEKKKKWGVF